MQTRAKVVIIGGGVIGCSVAYHLARKGWTDVVLCERDELTAGATTHAVGNVILYTLDPTISKLNQYSVDLYPRLEAETGVVPGFHQCGNMRLASHPERLDEFHRYMDVAAATGVRAELLGVDEIKAIYPLIRTEGLLGAILNPEDGYASPADLTQALAAGARQGGVKFHCGTEVTGLTQSGAGWLVETTAGTIRVDHVVSATGNFAQRSARMLGRNAQSVPVRHQYIITEPLAELSERRRTGLPELPVFRDPEQSFYVRQEGDCLLMGAYDGRGDAMFVDDVPAGYGRDPLPDDLDRLLPYLGRAIGRLPVLETLGVQSVINSPMPYTPDDLPMTGPSQGLKNMWLAEGNPFGITLAGGIGWQLAEWMTEGEPTIDMWCCDSRRYGGWAGRKWAARKVEEAYEHTYLLPKPGEEMQAGRGLRCSELHDLMAARGAVFGVVAGWEQPNWFAPEGMEGKEVGSFHRANWFGVVGEECRRPFKTPVMADISHIARFGLKGAGAREALVALMGEMPTPGKSGTRYVLGQCGTVLLEFSVLATGADSFVLATAPEAGTYGLDLLQRACADMPDLKASDLTGREGGLLLFGKGMGEVIVSLSGDAATGVVIGGFAKLTIGYTEVLALRQSAYGLPAWRLHCPAETLRNVFHTLEAADVGLIGARAMAALRVERGIPAWGAELTGETTLADAGIAPGKTCRRLIHLRVTPQRGAPLGREPIRDGTGRIIGATTSGAWGHLSGAGYALGFVDVGADTGALEVQIMNTWHPAEVLAAERH